MAPWTNHVAIAAPRNGTNSHSVSTASGTAVAGELFTTTAGRFLVCIAYGPVTFTTPTGWTSRASTVNFGGLYAWTKTAQGGSSDDFTTTHNGSNYPVIFAIFEFAEGSSWINAATANNVAQSAANPNLTGLTGTPLVIGVKACVDNTAGSAISGTWNSPTTELVDTNVDDNRGAGGTEGFWLHCGYAEAYSGGSYQPTSTRNGSGLTNECITLAIDAINPPPAAAAGVLAGETDQDTPPVNLGVCQQFQRGTFTAAGRKWVIFADNGGATGQDPGYYVTSSPDGGQTWESPELLAANHTDMLTGAAYADFHFDGTYLHCAIGGQNTGPIGLVYRRGEPQSDGTIDWSDDWQTVVTVEDPVEVSITTDAQGRPWISYELNDNQTSPQAYVARAAASDGSFTNASGSPHQLTTDAGLYYAAVHRLAGGEMVVFYWSRSAVDGQYVFARVWNGASFDAEQVLDTTPRGNELDDQSDIATVSDPNTGRAWIWWRDENSQTGTLAWYEVGEGWDQQTGFDFDTFSTAALAIDGDGIVHLFYLTPSDPNIIRHNTWDPDLETWGEPETVVDHGDEILIGSLQVSERAYDGELVIAYEADGDPWAGVYVVAVEATEYTDPEVEDERNVTGTVTVSLAASGATAKTGGTAGSIALLLAAAGSAAKTTGVAGGIGLNITASDDASKTTSALGGIALSTDVAAQAAKIADTLGDLAVELGLQGAVTTTETRDTAGSIALALGADGAVSKTASAAGGISLSMLLEAAAAKSTQAAGALALALAMTGDAAKTAQVAASLGLNLGAVGAVSAVGEDETHGAITLALAIAATAAKTADADGALAMMLAAAGTAAKTGRATGGIGLQLALSGAVEAVLPNETTGSIGLALAASGSAAKTANVVGSLQLVLALTIAVRALAPLLLRSWHHRAVSTRPGDHRAVTTRARDHTAVSTRPSNH